MKFQLLIKSEYDQEIPLSHTTDQEEEPQTINNTVTRHKEDKQSKDTSSLFPIKMIAKLEKTNIFAFSALKQTDVAFMLLCQQ